MALTDSLVSYWKMDEASGSRSDSHGSTTLTDNNTVGSATGKISNAASFNGSDEYLSMSGNPGGGAASSGAFSVSLWMYLNTASGDRQALGWYSGSRLFQVGHTNTGDIRVAYGQSPFNAISVGSAASTLTWYHVVFTFSSSGTGTFYVDGSSLGTGGTLTGAFDAATDLNIGRRGGDGVEYFNGLIDEVGWWSRELTSSEVSELYASGSGLAYPFGASSAPVVTPFRNRLMTPGHIFGGKCLC